MMGRMRESWFDGVKDSTDRVGQLVVNPIDLPPRRTSFSSLLASRCTALVPELSLGQPLAGTVGYGGHGSLLVRDAAPGQHLPSQQGGLPPENPKKRQKSRLESVPKAYVRTDNDVYVWSLCHLSATACTRRMRGEPTLSTPAGGGFSLHCPSGASRACRPEAGGRVAARVSPANWWVSRDPRARMQPAEQRGRTPPQRRAHKLLRYNWGDAVGPRRRKLNDAPSKKLSDAPSVRNYCEPTTHRRARRVLSATACTRRMSGGTDTFDAGWWRFQLALPGGSVAGQCRTGGRWSCSGYSRVSPPIGGASRAAMATGSRMQPAEQGGRTVARAP